LSETKQIRANRLKDLSVIIVNHNRQSFLIQTLSSVSRSLSSLNHEVIVVDNASSDGSLAAVKQDFPSVKRIALSQNVGFARANNAGVRQSSGKYLFLLNNDTFVPRDAIQKLLELKKEHPEFGIVAPIVLHPDKKLQLSWGRDLHLFSEVFLKYFANRWYAWQFKRKGGKISRNVDWVSGACFLIERKLYEKIGGFDENFFLYVEDADLCRRIRLLGYTIHLTSEAWIIHYQGQSVSQYPGRFLHEAKRSQLYYYFKHNGRYSAEVLRFYLLVRFSLKLFICRLQRDRQKQEVCSEVLSTIKEFRYEDFT
jgi:GT2 family glycosyltransferase